MDFFVSDCSSILRCVGDKEIFVTVTNDGYKIFCRNNIPSFVEVPEIWSDQEEAEFLCAAFALTPGFNLVSIVTIDTDIVILGWRFSNKLEGNLFIKPLTKLTRIFDFTQYLLDANYCNALLGYHAVLWLHKFISRSWENQRTESSER